jgi:hypothetical protein
MRASVEKTAVPTALVFYATASCPVPERLDPAEFIFVRCALDLNNANSYSPLPRDRDLLVGAFLFDSVTSEEGVTAVFAGVTDTNAGVTHGPQWVQVRTSQRSKDFPPPDRLPHFAKVFLGKRSTSLITLAL